MPDVIVNSTVKKQANEVKALVNVVSTNLGVKTDTASVTTTSSIFSWIKQIWSYISSINTNVSTINTNTAKQLTFKTFTVSNTTAGTAVATTIAGPGVLLMAGAFNSIANNYVSISIDGSTAIQLTGTASTPIVLTQAYSGLGSKTVAGTDALYPLMIPFKTSIVVTTYRAGSANTVAGYITYGLYQ